MIPYGLKRAYYILADLPMRANAQLYRRFRAPRSGLKIHLGCGQVHYLEGWTNVDANLITARIDVWANFSKSLPFPDGSADLIYSHHVVEHLPDLPKHFAEMFRVLRPGGGIRIAGPHMGNACRKYLEGDTAWFWDLPDKWNSAGGRFTNFVFCRNEHLTALDESFLAELAENAGFREIAFCVPTQTTTLGALGLGNDVLSKEYEPDLSVPHTVVLEARKP